MHPEVMIMMARLHTSDLLKEAEMDHLSAAVDRAERARAGTHGPLSSFFLRLTARLSGLGTPTAPSVSRP
jgi:hypothetical protein